MNKATMHENGRVRFGSSDAVAIAAILVLTSAFCLPLLRNPLNLVSETDWLQKASYLAVGRRSLLEYGQFPLWSPYFGGGYPFMGHPENMMYNPILLAIVLAGNEWLAMKMIAVCAYFAGGVGMYLFARKVLGYTVPGGFFSAFLFCFNGYLPFHTSTGNFLEATYYYLPLLMLFLFLAQRDVKWVIAGGLVLAWNILGDGGLQVPNMCLFLVLFYMSGAVFARGGSPSKLTRNILLLLLALAIAVLFASIKLLPMLELLRENPRRMESYETAATGSVGIGTLAASLISIFPDPGAVSWPLPEGSLADSTIFMGIIPPLLAAAAFIWRWKKTGPFLPPLVVFALLTMGNKAPVDLFRLLWHLPIYGSLRMPNKYFAFFIAFIISAAAGAIVPAAARKKPRDLIVLAGAFLSMALLYPVTFSYHVSLAGTPAPRWPRQDFFQVMSEREDGTRQRYERDQYYLVLQGIGKINWYGNIYLEENSSPRFFYVYPSGAEAGRPNPAYRGEAYFRNGLSAARIERWSPNAMEIGTNVRESDILVVNQNYNGNWKSDRGRVIRYGGLLAVEGLPAGEHVVRLRFAPASFKIGAAITALSLLCALAWLLAPRRHKDTKDSSG